MTDVNKVEMIQHHTSTIKYYLDDIESIDKQIELLKEKQKELLYRAERNSNCISVFFRDKEFVDSLCEDFINKTKEIQNRVSNLIEKKRKRKHIIYNI